MLDSVYYYYNDLINDKDSFKSCSPRSDHNYQTRSHLNIDTKYYNVDDYENLDPDNGQEMEEQGLVEIRRSLKITDLLGVFAQIDKLQARELMNYKLEPVKDSLQKLCFLCSCCNKLYDCR